MFRDVTMSHLFSKSLIALKHHGFVLGKSTVANLLETADLISWGLETRLKLLVVFLEFSKALT